MREKKEKERIFWTFMVSCGAITAIAIRGLLQSKQIGQ
jgi:hypothetical protein